MPLIRIDLLAGKPPDYHATLRDTILIQITLNEGRTADRKRAYYAALAVARRRCIGVRRRTWWLT